MLPCSNRTDESDGLVTGSGRGQMRNATQLDVARSAAAQTAVVDIAFSVPCFTFEHADIRASRTNGMVRTAWKRTGDGNEHHGDQRRR